MVFENRGKHVIQCFTNEYSVTDNNLLIKFLSRVFLKKPHTCQKGGAHLNFFLEFIGELEKQIIKKTVKWANKNKIIY